MRDEERGLEFLDVFTYGENENNKMRRGNKRIKMDNVERRGAFETGETGYNSQGRDCPSKRRIPYDESIH